MQVLRTLVPLDTTPEEHKIVTLNVNGTVGRYKFIKEERETTNAKIWRIKSENQPTPQIHALKTFNEKYITQIQISAPTYDLASEWTKIKDLVRGIGAFAWVDHSYCPTTTNPDDRDYKMSIIMPWLDGNSIGDMHEMRKDNDEIPFSHCDFKQIALIFIQSLAELEAKNVAHIDICSDNVLIDVSDPKKPKVHIIDIDEMHHECLSPPPFVRNDILGRGAGHVHGQMGFRFPESLPNSGWHVHADRYSAAILLSQILAFNDPDVQAKWCNEHGYFNNTSNMDSDDQDRRQVLLKALQSQGFDALHKHIETTLNSTQHTDISTLPALKTLADALLNDLNRLTNGTAQSVSNSTTSINPPQISTLDSNQLSYANSQHIPYKTFATSRAPVLFVFVVDISQSMYENIGIDNAIELCNQLLRQLRRNAQSTIIVPRYHVALFCYHSQAINVFDTLEKDNPGTLGSIGIPPTSRRLAEYPSIVTISQLENFTLSQHIIDKIRPPKVSAKYVQTDYSEAFDTVQKFLSEHIQKYADSHPPYVYHITDGRMTDLNTDDVKQRAQNIRGLSTNYGNVLLSHVLIDRSIQSSKEQNQHIIGLLKQISSPMPAQYAGDVGSSLEFPCLFYYPCVDELNRFIVKTSMTGSSKS
jgi:serine/threonine protein kinase